jgi:hypothetical protein
MKASDVVKVANELIEKLDDLAEQLGEYRLVGSEDCCASTARSLRRRVYELKDAQHRVARAKRDIENYLAVASEVEYHNLLVLEKVKEVVSQNSRSEYEARD